MRKGVKSGCYDIVLLEDNISKEELLERESWHIMCNRDMCVNILDPVTKMKLYDNGEEKRERDKLRDKYMIREVCRVIKESSIEIKSMDDIYVVYMDKRQEIIDKRKTSDDSYYKTLIEFNRLNRIDV